MQLIYLNKISFEIKNCLISDMEVFLKSFFKILIMSALFNSSLSLAAVENNAVANNKVDAFDQAAMEAIKSKVETRLKGMVVKSIKPAPLANWFEIVAGGEIYYVTRNADHLFTGQLIAIKDEVVNLTERSKVALDSARSPMRAKVLADLSEDSFVTFAAKEEKHRVDVFIDADCGYCRKLHQRMDEMNDLGITVRYLGFPRSGLGTASHKKLEEAWCSVDQKTALDKVMAGGRVVAEACKNPVADHYRLVPMFGLTGTPAVVFSNGDLIPGYMEPKRLLAELEKRGL